MTVTHSSQLVSGLSNARYQLMIYCSGPTLKLPDLMSKYMIGERSVGDIGSCHHTIFLISRNTMAEDGQPRTSSTTRAS